MKDLILTPEELLFLGRLMKGKYLDYSYYTRIKDCQGNGKQLEWTCSKSLGDKNILHEQLNGTLSLDYETQALLRPVYFGTAMSSLQIFRNHPERSVGQVNFHWAEDCCTVVFVREKDCRIMPISQQQLSALVAGLMPSDYNKRNPKGNENLNGENVQRLLVFCRGKVGEHMSRLTIMDGDGWLYKKNTDGSYEVLTPHAFCDQAMLMLKGM